MGRRRQVVMVAGLFLLLGLVSLWPLPADPAETALAVRPMTDYRLSMYLIHWGAHALMTDPLELHHTNMFYPERYTYAYSTMELSQSVLALPVVAAFENPVLTYNFSLLASIVLGGTGFFLLARRITGSPGAAVFGAAVYVFNPARFGRLSQIQLFSDHWLPWAAWALLIWFAAMRRSDAGGRRGGDRHGWSRWLPVVAVAFTFCLHALSGAHNAVFGALFGVAAVAWGAARERLWARRRFWIDLVAVAILVVVVLGPVFYPYLVVEERMLEKRGADFVSRDRLSARPYELLASNSRFYRWLDRRTGWPSALFDDRLRTFLFPGLVPLVLAALGALAAGSRRGAGKSEDDVFPEGQRPTLDRPFWIGVFVCCLLLALGPRFRLYLVLSKLPGIRLIRVPSRFFLPAAFALSAVAAYGARWLIRTLRQAPRRRAAILLLLAAAFAVEAAFVPIPTRHRPAEPMPWVRWLGEQPGEFTVLEVPATPDSFAIAMRQVLESVHHWKNLIVGYSGFRSDRNERLQRYIRRRFPSERCLDLLERLEVRYVVALEGRLGRKTRRALHRQSRLQPVKRFDQAVVYRLLSGGEEKREGPPDP